MGEPSKNAWSHVQALFKETLRQEPASDATHEEEPSQWSHVLGLFNATRKEEPSQNAWSHVQALFKETLRQEPANDAWSHVVGLFKTTHKNTARHGHKHPVVKSPLNHVVELF